MVKRVLSSPIFVAGVIAFGCLLRIAQYVSGRALFLDEATVTLNIVDQPFRRLFGTLYYNEAGPSGWLFLERMAVDLLGPTEDALRLTPLLFGLASLPLFYLVARQLLGRAGAGAALAIFAVLDGPILYASEVKQYSDDICLTLAVLALGFSLTGRRLTVSRTIAFASLGAVAVWLSHPVVFVLAGVGSALVVDALVTHDRARLGRLFAAIAAWLLSFTALYAVNIRTLPPALGSYFLPRPTSPHNVIMIVKGLEVFVRGTLYMSLTLPLAITAVAVGLLGVWSVSRRQPVRAAMMFATVLLTVIVSSAGRYPWGASRSSLRRSHRSSSSPGSARLPAPPTGSLGRSQLRSSSCSWGPHSSRRCGTSLIRRRSRRSLRLYAPWRSVFSLATRSTSTPTGSMPFGTTRS